MLTFLYERPLATVAGDWREQLYYDGQCEAVAILHGDIHAKRPVPLRIHSDCLSSHLLLSIECDCREQMLLAQRYIVSAGAGVIITLPQDGRGLGHQAIMMATELARRERLSQSEAFQIVAGQSDGRTFNTAAKIIEMLRIEEVALLTNNPDKVKGLEALGVHVSSMVPLMVEGLAARPELRESYRDKLHQGHALGSGDG